MRDGFNIGDLVLCRDLLIHQEALWGFLLRKSGHNGWKVFCLDAKYKKVWFFFESEMKKIETWKEI